MDLYNTSAKGPAPSGSNGRDCSEAKSCADCRTTITPLWRGGPSGPKTLCNACGIRYRKKRRGALGLKDGGGGDGRKRERKHGSRSRDLYVKLGVLGFGRDVVPKERFLFRKRTKLREEEEAAVLLMALSSGLLYA